ncbi:TerC family protein [Cohnella fermenti]|nr:TerC family protein [Cohnella fermenti]
MIFVEIVLINLLLSGDNAIVIAMAARRLPPLQRRAAVWWGTAAAVALRCVLTLAAVALLNIPFMQTAGALFLFAIALKLLLDHGGHEPETRASSTLAGAVWTIVTADFVMSLDNVLAVAAVAKGDTILLLFGIALSIPIIIWGSSFIIHLLDRAPYLVYIGGGLLGYASGEMLLKDPGLRKLLPLEGSGLAESLPLLIVAALLAAALLLRRKRAA